MIAETSAVDPISANRSALDAEARGHEHEGAGHATEEGEGAVHDGHQARTAVPVEAGGALASVGTMETISC